MIYEQERDWKKAVDMARALKSEKAWSGSKRAALPLHKQIAQYYCEMAEEQWGQQALSGARAALKAAFSEDPECVRASLLLGNIEFQLEHYQEAIVSYQRLVRQDMVYLSEAVRSMRTAFVHLGREDDFKDYLVELMPACEDASPMLALADSLLEQEGGEKAVDFVASCLRDRPTVAGLKKLIELKLPLSSGQSHQDLVMLQELLSQLIADRPSYLCSNCGFAGRSLHWQCPSCTSWTTIKPVPGMRALEIKQN